MVLALLFVTEPKRVRHKASQRNGLQIFFSPQAWQQLSHGENRVSQQKRVKKATASSASKRYQICH